MLEKPVIKVKNLWVKYGDNVVLEDVSFELYKSDFLGVIGPNGAGKSTLLKVLLGLISPDRGKIEILGGNHKKNRKCIGYVPQYSHFDKEFPISVFEAVLTGRSAKTGLIKRYSTRDKEITLDVLKKVEIIDLKDRQIGKLSGGQQQRLLIARALVIEPKILLLDEPTASVDAQFEKGLYGLLKELNKDIPIALVSHDISTISTYINKIACINKKLHFHDSSELTSEIIEETYQCPVELLSHGFIPHRVLRVHQE